jgi:hypothetical protein
MEICNQPIIEQLNQEDFIYSKPYKLTSTDNWKVNLTNKNTKEKNVLEFGEKTFAENFYKDPVLQLYTVNIVDSEGNFLRSEKFFSKYHCEKFIKKKQKEEIKKNDQLDILKMESKQNSLLGFISPSATSFFDDEEITADSDIEEKKEEHRLLLASYEEQSKLKAKNFLLKLAEFYVGTDIMTEDNYIKYKLSLEEDSLSGMMEQLSIHKKAITKISETIHISENVSTKMYESLATLSRLVFDVNKYLHEYSLQMEQSFKKIREDIEEYSPKSKTQEAEFTIVSETGSITTNDRTKLIGELNKFIEDSKNRKIPKSVNERLSDKKNEEKYVDNQIFLENSSEESEDEDKENHFEEFK